MRVNVGGREAVRESVAGLLAVLVGVMVLDRVRDGDADLEAARGVLALVGVRCGDGDGCAEAVDVLDDAKSPFTFTGTTCRVRLMSPTLTLRPCESSTNSWLSDSTATSSVFLPGTYRCTYTRPAHPSFRVLSYPMDALVTVRRDTRYITPFRTMLMRAGVVSVERTTDADVRMTVPVGS